MKKIVIVGGGFAGINLAKQLSHNEHFEVIIVDKNNYNYFPPLLYQVSSAFIEPSNISYPFRRFFQNIKNVRFFMGDFISVQPEQNTIQTDSGMLPYDYLVLAMGTETNFFGNQNLIDKALPMKSIDEAIQIRNHILLRMEEAVRSESLYDKSRLSTLVIAGGGPTGVELAGMLAEMGQKFVSRDYPEFSDLGSIYLVDGGPVLLAPMSSKAQKEALKVLTNLGVKVILNTLVKDYVDDHVILSNGENIPSATLIWASGVIGRQVEGLPKETIGPGRRIYVNEINLVYGQQNIFAIGDQCLQTSQENYPKGHPQLVQVAMQQGSLLGKNLIRLQQNKSARSFTYFNKGSMAIISKHKAVVDLPKGYFQGLIAWLVWLFIHILPQIGLQNKAKLASNWLWSFITDDPTLRLIIRPRKK